MDLKEIIFALCSAQGVSGSEESACAVAARYLEPYSEVRTDHNGNLFATLGNPDAKKTVLLDAHLDRIGLIVTDINDKGFVKVDKCGGMDIRVLQNAVLTTEDGLTGTVCSLPPHLSDGSEDKATPINKIWLDFGMSYEEVSRKISVGDKLTFRERPTELMNGKITSPALDNRCSVAALIRVAELLSGRELDCKVVILLSAQEETYGSGAMTGAFQIDADEAIVVDVSFANQPDVSGQYGNIELNKGPMLGYSPILNRQMTERLKALAESEG
ncbi:MAG: M42 family peptidase, partial [Ruminococcus sp.]|nr:M42 family peptidase [Ruminococcus sp.]